MTWRNRIVGYGTKRAGEFLANPYNWRIHPATQQQALEGTLRDVGWVANVIENQRTGHLVDGHQRVLSALKYGDDTEVPVTYVDLSEEEERVILAVLDPIGAMAVADKDVLGSLLGELASTEVATVLELVGHDVGPVLEDVHREQAERFAVTLTFMTRAAYRRAIAVLGPPGHEPPGPRCTLSGENAIARLPEGVPHA